MFIHVPFTHCLPVWVTVPWALCGHSLFVNLLCLPPVPGHAPCALSHRTHLQIANEHLYNVLQFTKRSAHPFLRVSLTAALHSFYYYHPPILQMLQSVGGLHASPPTPKCGWQRGQAAAFHCVHGAGSADPGSGDRDEVSL